MFDILQVLYMYNVLSIYMDMPSAVSVEISNANTQQSFEMEFPTNMSIV